MYLTVVTIYIKSAHWLLKNSVIRRKMYFLEFHVEQFDFQLTFINQYKSFIWKLRALLNQTKDFIKIINKRKLLP